MHHKAATPDLSSLHLGLHAQASVTHPHGPVRLADASDGLLHARFEAQVQRTPDAIALIADNQRFSYRDLNTSANRLARFLRNLGAGPEILVGVCMERSLEMVVSIMAVLKAGGAYVPLDPAYPRERLKYMMEDAAISLLLATHRLNASLPSGPSTVICVDGDEWAQENPANLEATAVAENLAYVIYTSGSTGLPKGVCVTHQNICNHMDWMQQSFAFSPADIFLQKTPFSFDASVWEFYAPLLSGGTLVMARPGGHRDPDYLAGAVMDHGISVLQLVPSQLKMLLQTDQLERCSTLTHVFCGGEPLDGRDLADLNARLKCCKVVTNLYGPTECTIDATSWSYRSGSVPYPVPIGRPIANAWTYILDSFGEPVQAGSAGELGISGLLLARGYLNRPDLTAEKFVPNPFSTAPGDRLFRTGDVAKCNAVGEIECHGRLDDQIKIRGHRIELGEIEAVLASHPMVRQAAVAPWGDGPEKQLAGYIVPASASPERTELRQYLQDRLPEYMIPSALVVLRELPLGTSGKLDRKALPEPEEQWSVLAPYEEPRTSVEKKLAEIWKQTLHRERIGRDDDFFALGGHSLLATVSLARIRHEFNVSVPLQFMFENPTVVGIAGFLENAGKAESGFSRPSRYPRQDSSPLSFSQERVWFLEKLHRGNLAYNYQSLLRFHGPLSVASLEFAFTQLVHRHEILRTTFQEIDGRPVQVIHSPSSIQLLFVDLSTSIDPELEAQALVRKEIETPFNLQRGPLVHWTLFRLAADDHQLLHKEHHSLHDGWSFNILLEELFKLYRAHSTGQALQLSELPIQFADFAQWQREWISSHEAQSQIDYWKNKLASAHEILALPWDFARPAVLSPKGGVIRRDLTGELSDRLRSTSRQQKTTLFMMTFTAFLVLLHRLSSSTDLCVGTGIANRRWKETENLIGMLVNNVVLRVDLSANPSLSELLEQVKAVTLEAYAHQDVPFDKVVEALHPKRDPSSNPLFQVMFSFHDSPLCSFEGLGPRVSLTEGISNGSAKWDLNVVFIPRAEQKVGSRNSAGEPITMIWEYSSDLFQSGTVERWVGLYENVLRTMTASLAPRVGDLPLMTSEQRKDVLEQLNPSRAPYPREATLPELFAEQVQARSKCQAVCYEGASLTYGELNRRANQLAHYLHKKGVTIETPIGVSGERSLEMVIAVLALAKIGAVCVPLDPDTPVQRQRWLVQDICVPMILVVERGKSAFSESGVELVSMDAQISEITTESADDPQVRLSPENLAYVIYTSGSTGTPKGVAVPHRGVVRLVKSANYVELTPNDRLLQFSPLTFDPSTFEIWGSLLNGAGLVIMSAGKQSLEALGKVIRESGITVLWLSSGIFHLMAEYCTKDLQTVRYLLAGGDVVAVTAVKKYLSGNPSGVFVDGYGPTENSTFTCCHVMREGDPLEFTVPIGKPVSNTQVYVLDDNLEPVPPGVVGEIYTGGDGLARGYLNRPDLTAERFIPNPFGVDGERLYRIGDLVRFRGNNVLEFLGRKDQQVKIRGFRIELGEIESILGQHEAVREGIVLVEPDITGQNGLVAYVVPHHSIDKALLQTYLRDRLPHYMVPASIIFIPEMPLTRNGKIDRRKLREDAILQRSNESTETTGESAARNEVEDILTQLWAEMLELETVGIHDNFFDVGGHSLLLMQMLARVKAIFGFEIHLRDVFELPIISHLSKLISSQSRHAGAAAPAVERRGLMFLPASFAQRRLWFLENLAYGDSLYTVPMAHRLHGRVDLSALEKSLNLIISRHEALRTRFEQREGEPWQIVEPELEIRVEVEDLTDLEASQRESVLQARIQIEARRGFDLSRLPLIRARLFQLGPEDYALMTSMHHIITDAASLRIFNQELKYFYEAHCRGEEPALASPAVQYADYTVWQRENLSQGLLAPEREYWRKQLAGAPESLRLPADYPRPEFPRYTGASHRFVMDQAAARELKKLACRNGVTVSMTLLAAYSVLLHRFSEQPEIVIGLPVANRGPDELQKLIGLFVNILPIRIDVRGNPTFRQLLQRIRGVTLAAFAHQAMPFEQLVEDLNPVRFLNRNPLFQVVFNLLGSSDTGLQLSGIETAAIVIDSGNAKFDLYLEAVESDHSFQFRLIHDSDLFALDTATEIQRRFKLLLQEILDKEFLPINELDLLLSDEKAILNEEPFLREPEEEFLL
ncbi:MAG TPA: amino acid adenylation domain-containing protein [Candidatus Angelobacter sp.]|nr:amino acid adenylation domain-containing protein [Candidatus Angelobacter sp.]